MRIFALLLAGLALVTVAAALWQHFRYLDLRRNTVHDLQPLFYSSRVFHVITFLEVEPGQDVIEEVRKWRDQVETAEGTRLVYAGKVLLNARQSDQLHDVAWSAIVVAQHPSREAYDALAASGPYRRGLAAFASSYSHGMERWRAVNLLLPQFLLARRVAQLATFQPSYYPLQPATTEQLVPEARAQLDRIDRIRAETELGAHAVAIVNLIRRGTPEQQAADSAYGWKMMGAMAEGAHGPMHMGRAVAVEGEARFDQVAIVFYPGVEYFANLVGSSFFRGIIGGKQLADTQASITVPILSRL